METEYGQILEPHQIKDEPYDEGYENMFLAEDNLEVKIEVKEEFQEDDFVTMEEDSSLPSHHLNSPDSTCQVEILEQPIKKVRFRYLSELQGTPHGPLLGLSATKTNKTFPQVRLVGYEGRETVKIRCWLVDKYGPSRHDVRPHCHDLVVKKACPRNEIVYGPHDITVCRENNYTAVFENMVVLHCVQKDSECKYHEKEVQWGMRSYSDNLAISHVKIPKAAESKRIRETIKSINKNEVYLFFEAYIVMRNSVQILCQTLTNPIKNLKNPNSGDLKICKSLNTYGPCEGNTEVALFTERVPPDVKVKMFLPNSNWEELITPEYMHRNLALTFKTPKYPDLIKDDVRVKFCLFRESDGGESNIFDFVYQPSSYGTIGVKRKRMNETLDLGNSAVHEMGFELEGERMSAIKNNVMLSDSSIDIDVLLEDSFNPDSTAQFSGSALSEILELTLPPEENFIYQAPMQHDGLYIEIKDLDCLTSATKVEKVRHIEFAEMGEARIITPVNSRDFTDSRRPIMSAEGIKNTLKDVALTCKYSNHMNVLQKLVELDLPQKLDMVLFNIYHNSRFDNDKLMAFIRNVRNTNNMTLLHMAIQLGREECIRILLFYDFDALAKDKNGNTCFHLSAKSSSINITQSIQMRSRLGCCYKHCFYYDSKKRYGEGGLCKSLRNRRYRYNYDENFQTTNLESLNVLHFAVRERNAVSVKWITSLTKSVLNSQIATTGDTALHLACRLQYTDIAEVLIARNADTSIVNLQGYSPLHISVSMNDYKTAALLIKNKSNPLQICVSLVNPDFDDEEAEGDESTQPTNDCTAFALANDEKMIKILNGKFDSISVATDEDPAIFRKDDTINNKLLTEDQVQELTEYLKEDKKWCKVVGKLCRPHLNENFFKYFKNPERALVTMINLEANDFFGSSNQKEKLIDLFTSLNMNDAADIVKH